MDFSYFLSSYMADAAYGGKRVYADLVEQACAAEKLGYRGVAIPEHHLINILMVPSPLQMAVKIASLTRRIEIATSVVVLPIRDVRILAGEIVQAHVLCDERLIVGVGRGAFPYETARLGAPLESTRERFEESLAILEALLTREEVSWDGKYYRFEPITVMPRPASPIPFVIAAVSADGIYRAAKRGYHVQTTPLSGSHEVLLRQVEAFRRGKEEAGAAGRNLRLSLQRGIYAARNEADARQKIALAHDYYKRFDNIKNQGIVRGGMIEPLPRRQTLDELGQNLLIGTSTELVDRLSVYAELGIDEVLAPCGYGQSAGETLEMMHRFADEVMPHFRAPPAPSTDRREELPMPVIRVERFAGPTREQKSAFAKAVTDAFVSTCGGTPQSIQVVFQDVATDDRGGAGLACSPAPSKVVDCVYAIEGRGPSVFLIHGIGARRQGWAGLVEHLKPHFQCISYDLRGHGDSPKSEGTFGLDDLVADLEALRAKLCIERAHVIGHSLGGMIGPAYARAYPQRVLSLGLLSTAAFRTPDDSAKVQGVVATMERSGIPQTLDTLADRWFTDTFMKEQPARIAARKRQVLETDAKVFLNVFHIYAETEMAPWLHELKVPCLVLTGELDGGCNPRLNRQIADALANSELVILDGLKHAILIEAPDRVAPPILRFLKACS